MAAFPRRTLLGEMHLGLEQPSAALRIEPGPGILHQQAHEITLDIRFQTHLSALRGEFERIGQQITQHRRQHFPVGQDGQPGLDSRAQIDAFGLG